LQSFLETSAKDLLVEIKTKAKLDDELEAKISAVCKQWKASFSA